MSEQLFKKLGLRADVGLGKDNQGATEHVKVARKDDVLGIGYKATVADTWSTQSVGFASVLAKFQQPKDNVNDDNGDDDDEASPQVMGPIGGASQRVYSKRSRLKTEALSSELGRAEVLGSAAKVARKESSEGVASLKVNLRSPVLVRMVNRSAKHETQATVHADGEPFAVTYPTPKPPKASESPFAAPI